MRVRRLLVALLAGACVAAAGTVPAPASPSAPASAAGPATPAAPAGAQAAINGNGSSYVGLAMDQWTAEAQTQGLDVNYTPTGSPQGLRLFRDRSIDFAGTEAEFSSLGLGSDDAVQRGFQYVPDVAGAVAIMYNVQDEAGRRVDYLRLSPSTVAKIFMGFITHWSDPQITNDLGGGIVLPNEEIVVTFRSGESGTTALFYDFVQHAEPRLFAEWVAAHRLPTAYRIIDLNPGSFAPKTLPAPSSEALAQSVKRVPWSIGYDEFGYAKVYGNDVAWIRNAAGQWVRPYAANISAALETAQLRPDLSQDLRNVYGSPNPAAYPISAYSYMVTQCAPSSDRSTCKGNYANTGVAETLDAFMRYVACAGQIQMAELGYAPLPPQLSQFVADAIGRMWGRAPERLTRANCANPRFDPNYLPPTGEPPPPLPDPPGVGVILGEGEDGGDGGDEHGPRTTTTPCPTATTSGTSSTSTTSTSSTSSTSTTADPCATPAAAQTAAAGRAGDEEAVGGGSDDWRGVDPVAFNRPGMARIGRWPLLVVLLVLILPVAGGSLYGIAQQHRRRNEELGVYGPPAAPSGPAPG